MLTRMADAAARRAIYADLLAVPRHLVAEIIHGAVVTHPRPGAPHANASSTLGWALTGPFRFGKGGPGGWVILDEPELHLGEHILVPDLAGWRRERMREIPNTAAFELAPDWICEVVSPSTSATDRADKLPIYAAEQVGHAWLIDPLAHTLEVFRLDGAGWRLAATFRDDAIVRAEPFDAIELELAVLWAR
ncbi:MAG: hypothetical protein NVS3B20_06290 [Polyangiales bacterium]